MDPQQQHLFNLMAVVQESQHAMQTATEALATERTALARERAALAHERAAVTQATAQLSTVTCEVRKAATDAVGAVVLQATQGAAVVAARALGSAAQPVMEGLAGVVQAASEAEGSMRQASAWFAWKWIALAAAGTAGVCCVALMAVWGLTHQVEGLRLERDELQATVDLLASKGGRATLSDCGGRRCFEVSANQGTKKSGEWRGPKGERFIIPQGY